MRRSLSIITMLLILGTLAVLITGCPPRQVEVVEVDPIGEPEPVRTASDLAVELTYPQSDDQGHYVAIHEPGEVIVEGVVSGPQAPRVIEVNGAAVQTYQVEQIAPYGLTGQYPTYRFRAPVVIEPQDEIIVVAGEPYDGLQYTFVADTSATIDRWSNLSSDDPFLLSRLGSAHYANRAYDEAITHLTSAAERDDPWVLYDLGMAYLALERGEDALASFARVEPVYVEMPDLYFARGLTHHTMGTFDQAIADFTRSAELAPDWAEPLLALGMTYYTREMLNDAANRAEDAIEIWPMWAAPYYTLAMVRLDQDRVDDAVVLVHEAEQRGPWRAQHHEALARKLYDRGNYVAARRQLEIARRLGGTRAGWWAQVEQETPEYRGYDGWPWQARVLDDGYRVPPGHAWHRDDRPARQARGRAVGPTPGRPDGPSPGRGVGPSPGTPDGPPPGRGDGPPPGAGPDGAPGRGGPPAGTPGQGGPPPGAGTDGAPGRGGPPAGTPGQGGPPPGRGR